MFTSFNTALSGLNANTMAIDVVGNNLANLNTTGYKAETLSFHDLVTQSVGGLNGSTQVGFGVALPIAINNFTQGATQGANGPLDAAIQGDGFFIVSTPAGATQYTRDGTFEVNAKGQITTPTSELLQGWSLTNGVLDTNTPIGNITVPTGTLAAPIATQNASVTLNLDASAVNGAANGTFSTSEQIYDSLGISHIVTFTFTKTTTANQWSYSAGIPAADTTSASTPVTGTINFDTNGNLTSPAVGDPPVVITAAGLVDGAADLNVNWNFYNGTTPLLTQFAQPSNPSAVSQDGAASANLTGVAMADGGQVIATYSNGKQVQVGQVALASVRNPQSMVAVGDNEFQIGGLTADPVIGLPGTGGRGFVKAGALESSTVDIAKEFTNLIVYQRGYQANAKVITTVDQISQDTINLKQ